MIRRRMALLLAVAVAQAGAQSGPGASAPASEPFAKPDWIVARAWCPIGCSEATQAQLKAQLGAVLHLAAGRLDARFVDACDGSVRYSVKTVAAAVVVGEVNEGLAPHQRRLAPADLGVAASAQVTTAWALCHGAGGDMNFAHLLLIAPDRVVLLSEEQSLIELR